MDLNPGPLELDGTNQSTVPRPHHAIASFEENLHPFRAVMLMTKCQRFWRLIIFYFKSQVSLKSFPFMHLQTSFDVKCSNVGV